MNAMVAPNVNVTTQSDLYPDYGGATLGAIAGGSVDVMASSPASSAPVVYGAGHPFVWGAAIIIAFLFVGWLAHRLGRGEGFANTNVSAITIVVSGASAALFIYALKLFALWTKTFSPNNGFAVFALGL